MRQKITSETVDLCYIDPPFNSKRDYFLIFNNQGKEDKALARAFEDVWEWGEEARLGLLYVTDVTNLQNGKIPEQTVELIRGLTKVLKEGALLAYIIHITLRVLEIHRVLKDSGSFYLHCDMTASHYLKLIVDSIFCSQGGDFRNEIIWYYYNKMHDSRKKLFPRATDTIFFYVKNVNYFRFKQLKEMRDAPIKQLARKKLNGKIVNVKDEFGHVVYRTKEDKTVDNVWRIPCIQPADRTQRMGYPTQKPEAILERVIEASSSEGDVVLVSIREQRESSESVVIGSQRRAG